MPRLLLLRHGRTSWNVDGRFQGQQNIPLDDLGLAQVLEVGPVVADAKPAAVWSSDSVRARVTAEAIGLPVVLDARLREIDLGTHEGMTPTEWDTQDPGQHALWRAGYDVRRGGGETYLEVGVRALSAVREAIDSVDEPDDLVVVVSHGGTIRAILTGLLELPGSPWGHLGTLGNCCGALLTRGDDGRGWRLLAYGVRAEFLLESSNR